MTKTITPTQAVRNIKTLLKPLILFPFGTCSMQQIFEWFRKLSLIGLHIGRGRTVADSGEKHVLQYVKHRLFPTQGAVPPRIFDVGANCGDWSEEAYAVFGSEHVEIFAFEPSIISFERLRERLQYPTFHAFNMGLGSQTTEAPLFSNEPASGLASLYCRRLDHLGIAFRQELHERVRIETLDDFCRERQIHQIDFLKLDVEGHELRVLEGAKQLIDSRSVRFIQFEFGGCNIDSRTFFQDFFYLLNEHYRLFRVLKTGLHPIPTYREIDECFLTTNFFAELRT